MYVCSAWRQEAREYLWKKLYLTIDDKRSEAYIDQPGLRPRSKPSFIATNLVRELRIKVSGASIASGAAHKILTELMGDTATMIQARKLCVTITDGFVAPEEPMDSSIDNVLEFTCLLRSMTQDSLAAAELYYRGSQQEALKCDEELFASLLGLLFRNSKHQVLELGNMKFKHSSTIDCIPQLSSLSLNCYSSLILSTNLVHKCAYALQHLVITSLPAQSLIYDMDGKAVIYPKLQHLKPSFDYNDPIERMLALDVVPFPVLKCLILYSCAQLGDDVMFRGNSATLEKLVIYLDARDVAVLSTSPVFNNGFRNLRTLIIDDIYSMNNLTQVPIPTMHKFIRNLAANTCKLSLTRNVPVSGLIDLTSSNYQFENIQFLDMKGNKSLLHDILRLLKALPVLARLECDIDDLDSGFKLLTDDDLPDHVASNFGNAGKHLHTWLLPHGRGQRSMKVADYVMLLAIACPRLMLVETLSIDSRSYHTRVTEASRSGPFSKYASRLIRLLDGIIIEEEEYETNLMNIMIDDD
ncbi:hypothetical protein GGI16_003957 [Coemansia sp. S142-1]|nr:hypothetical protein LPJ71_001646 [Coemansia sp. S17]KAJ2099585.1 hypothetical protein GGI16_003957 [Coemansia sp. S142-1]